MKFIASIVLALTFFTGLTQKEMKIQAMAAEYESGKLTKYSVDNGMVMKFKTAELKFNKDENGLVESIFVSDYNETFKFARYNGSADGWELYYEGKYDKGLFITEESIIAFKWGREGVSILAMYGSKYGNVKKAAKLIDEYAAAARAGYRQGVSDKDAARKELLANNTMEGHTVKKFEAELISKDSKLDCGSEFQVGYTITRDDGKVIKSITLGGNAIYNQYSIITKGVTKKKGTYENTGAVYVIDQYCETMEDKQVTVKVKVKGSDEHVRVFTLPTSCVPDPKIIAQKKKAEEDKKNAELLAIQKEKQAKQQEKDRAEKSRLADMSEVERFKSAIPAVKTSASKLSNGEVVGTGEQTGLIIFDSNIKFTNNTIGNDVKINNYQKLNGKLYGFGGNTESGNAIVAICSNGSITTKVISGSAKDITGASTQEKLIAKMSLAGVYGDIDAAGNVFYLNYGELCYATKSGNGYTYTKKVTGEKLFDNKEVVITSIASAGAGKCVVMGHVPSKSSEGKEYNAPWIALWNTGTGTTNKFLLDKLDLSRGIYGSQKINGKIIRASDGKHYASYQFNDYAMAVKIDVLASINKSNPEILWKNKFIVNSTNINTHQIIETKNKDVVIVITYDSYIKLLKTNAGGTTTDQLSFLHYNISTWGASDKSQLSMTSGDATIFLSKPATPRLVELPSGDFILSCIGKGIVEYPAGFSKINTKVNSSNPNLHFIGNKDFDRHSFDIVSLKVPNSDGTMKGLNSYSAVSYLDYDKTTKELVMYMSNPEMSIRVKPTLRTKWKSGPWQTGDENDSYVAVIDKVKDPKKPSNNNKVETKTSTKVEITYTGSGLIKFGDDRNTWGTQVGHDQTETLDCDDDIYIYRNVDGKYKRAEKVMSANTNCGESIEVE